MQTLGFSFISWALAKGVLQQMEIREHVCDILEVGEAAFIYKERKYGFRD